MFYSRRPPWRRPMISINRLSYPFGPQNPNSINHWVKTNEKTHIPDLIALHDGTLELYRGQDGGPQAADACEDTDRRSCVGEPGPSLLRDDSPGHPDGIGL